MLKMAQTNADGSKTLILGLSEANLRKLREDMPIFVRTGEVGGPPDNVVIFVGETETDMMEQLLEVGALGPSTAVRTPDQAAPFERLSGFIATMEEELDRFLRENPDDGIEYVKGAKEAWAGAFKEEYGLSTHDPMAIYTMFAGLHLLHGNVLQAEEGALQGGDGPDHLDVLKIMHFVIHNGMVLAALKRDL